MGRICLHQPFIFFKLLYGTECCMLERNSGLLGRHVNCHSKIRKTEKHVFFQILQLQWSMECFFDSFGFGFALWYRRQHENHSNPRNSHSNSSNSGLKDNATFAQPYVLHIDTPIMSCRCFDCRLTCIVGFSLLVPLITPIKLP